MDYEIHAFDRPIAASSVPNIAFDHIKAVAGRYQVSDLVQIPSMAGRKIVETDYPLTIAQQRFDNVRTNESGGAGNEPGRLGRLEACGKVRRKNGVNPLMLRMAVECPQAPRPKQGQMGLVDSKIEGRTHGPPLVRFRLAVIRLA